MADEDLNGAEAAVEAEVDPAGPEAPEEIESALDGREGPQTINLHEARMQILEVMEIAQASGVEADEFRDMLHEVANGTEYHFEANERWQRRVQPSEPQQ